jgi:hypothetical protein
MDRRRYFPSSEGLETRQLMASNVGNLFGLQVSANLNLPITYQARLQRIEHLPHYLEQIAPGRYLPKAEMQLIQTGLYNLIEVTAKPPSQGLNNYNYELRKVVDKQSLSPNDLARLNQTFTGVLNSAVAPPLAISQLSAALSELTTKVDTASVLPVTLATNDYSLVLQTALAVGRPMPSPTLPKLAHDNGINADAQHFKTPLRHPGFVGTYHFHTIIEVVNPVGNVFGFAKVKSNNNYRVNIGPALSPGIYEFRLRAMDQVGHLSRLSKPFLVKVVPKRHQATTVAAATPKGPAGKIKS